MLNVLAKSEQCLNLKYMSVECFTTYLNNKIIFYDSVRTYSSTTIWKKHIANALWTRIKKADARAIEIFDEGFLCPNAIILKDTIFWISTMKFL